MENPNNLPIETKDKSLLTDNPKVIKFADGLKRIGKVIGAGTIGFFGYGVAITAGSVPLALIGTAAFLGGVTRFAQNAYFKTEPNLLFGSKKVQDEIGVFQDPLNMNLMTRMIGYQNIDRAAMMGIQTLVGLNRYKNNLRDTPFEIDENGRKVYSQKFSTLTHSINLNDLKVFDALGYIKLDSMETKFKPKTADEMIKTMLAKDGVIKSYLLVEKLSFGNFKGAGKAIQAMFSKDEKFKDENRRVMQKATFRLTDKPVDFEEIRGLAKKENREGIIPPELEREARMLSAMPRIMNARKITLGEDRFGRTTLKYPSRLENVRLVVRNIKADTTRIKKKIEKRKNETTQPKKTTEEIKKQLDEKQNEFDASLKEGVTQPIINSPVTQENNTIPQPENVVIKTEEDEIQV